MAKFLAVLKREYLKRVRSRAFIVATILGPALMIGFMALPILIATLGAGEPVRLAVVDQTGRLYERVRQALAPEPGTGNSPARGPAPLDPGASPQERAREMGAALPGAFRVEEARSDGRGVEEVKRELNGRVLRGELDGYLVIPADILGARRAEYYGRNAGDLFTRAQLEEKLARSVNEQRLSEAGVAQELLREVSGRLRLNAIKVSERGEEKESEAAFFFVLGVGFLIFIMVLMYGGTILSAVVEEKETRVAEMLFSSVRAFPLMLGKLIGVSLVALTQFAVWGILVGAFLLFGVSALAGQGGVGAGLPNIGAGAVVYFLLFFLLGYFVYATVYALIGAVVTTQEESQPFVLLAVFPLLVAFYLVFPVLRAPDSALAFWASLLPLTSPVVMLVRIVTRTPPLWQIVLSLGIGFGTVVLLVWVAARVYRVGMLMYGKRATVPEILRWMRQA